MKRKEKRNVIVILAISIGVVAFLIAATGGVHAEKPDVIRETMTEVGEVIHEESSTDNSWLDDVLDRMAADEETTEEVSAYTADEVIEDERYTDIPVGDYTVDSADIGDKEVNYESEYSADVVGYSDGDSDMWVDSIDSMGNDVVAEADVVDGEADLYDSVGVESVRNSDPVEEIAGWTYIYEPYQWNSTYMGVHKITNTESLQWQWLQNHDWYENDEGIISYDGRILVALTPAYGGIGDYVDLLMEDGSILYCIIGDVKWNADTWGHWGEGGLNVIEIIVAEWWYSGHENKYYPTVLAFR